MVHPWHDVNYGEKSPKEVNVVIEVPKEGKNLAITEEVIARVKKAQSQRLVIEAALWVITGAMYVDGEARNYLRERRLAKFFGHSLGHGVGLEIHEDPRLSSSSETVLKEGMVVTVEPAVYLPNRFGIRIEDMVLVTQQGCKILSQ